VGLRRQKRGALPGLSQPRHRHPDHPAVAPRDDVLFRHLVADDAIFSVTCSTNGGSVNLAGNLDFYCGTFSGVIPGDSSLLYRLQAPPEATSLRLNAVNSADLVLSLEQGTVAQPGGPAQWTSYINENSVSGNQANATFSQSLTNPGGWPWLPGYAYYLAITNTAAGPESFSLITDGRAPATVPAKLAGTYGADGSFHLLVSGQVGSDYILQSASDLMNWLPLITNCDSFEYVDTSATNYPYHFYRTVVAP